MTSLSDFKFSWYWAAVVALLLLTALYSFYALSESPPTWYDEGLFIQSAQGLADYGSQAIQVAPHTFIGSGFVTGGYPYLAPVALSIKAFGYSLFAARMPMALFIILCVAAAFVLIRRIGGTNDALLALLLLATFPLLYGNGKNVLGEVPGIFYVLLALYFLWLLETQEYRGTRLYVLAGLCVGLAAATKPIFLLVLPAVGLVFLMYARFIPRHWKEIFLASLACAIPLALWVYLQFGVGDVASGTLFHYANPYAVNSLGGTIGENVLRFIKESTPLYCAALMGLWLLSVVIRYARGVHITFAESVAVTFSVLIMLAYLRTAGWYRYFFEAMVLALIFAPHSLRVIAREAEHFWPRARLAALVPLPLILLGAVQFYQLNFSSWVAEHNASTATAVMEQYFSTLPASTSIFVYDSPEAVPFIRTQNYYQFIQPTPQLFLGTDNFVLLEQGIPDQVVVRPAAYKERTDLFERYIQSATVGGYLVLTRI